MFTLLFSNKIRGDCKVKVPTIFFCYAWDEHDDERYRKLEYLRERIIQHSRRQVEVILDKRNYEENESFETLRNRIPNYDLIVVFCTPDLKEIIDRQNRNTSGKIREVRNEYAIIKPCFEKREDTVFPVVFEGTKDTALLKIFEGKNVREYDSFGITKNKRTGRYTVQQRTEFNRHVEKIINRSVYNLKHKSPEYASAKEALDKLFKLRDNTDLPESCLVQSDIYPLVLNQTSYFVAGRKGAGKSTFIHNFRKMDEKRFDESYKQMNPISAEEINLEKTYYDLVVAHQNDLSTIDMYDILCVFWQVVFYLHCVLTICYEIDDYSLSAKDSRFKAFDKYCKKLKTLIGLRNGRKYKNIKSDLVPDSIFGAARELVSNQFGQCLNKVSEDELLITAFSARFKLQEIVESNFGIRETANFLDALNLCKKKIMLSLDGFNTRSDDFRKTTERTMDQEERQRRVEFERLFYRTLIEVVTKYKNDSYSDPVSHLMSKYVDFCIVLPKDRYDQIIEDDRDSFKKHFASLSWTAYELLQLVTKRIEYLISKITGKQIESDNDDWFERMDSALNYFSGLPKSISMEVQSNVIRMPLFNYVLRSSFWRPRDVISNLSALLSHIVRVDSSGNISLSNLNKLTEDEVKLAIKDNSQRIIKEEFVQENGYVFSNLQEVLDALNYCHEQMTINEFKQIIRKVDFIASYSYDLTLVESKMSVLYQLGVIGLRFENRYSQAMHYLHNICFVFNAGMVPFEEFIGNKNIDEADVQIVINPIFARALRLSFDNTKELLGNWPKEYVLENYKMKVHIRYL